MVSINEKITELRLSKGIKQSDVARAAGLKQPSYASIEKGETKSITIEAGKGIAKALGVSFIELFEIEIPENNENEQLKYNLLKLQYAYIQERSISEIMVYATIEKALELHKQGKKIELTSQEVRQDAIKIYQKEYPDIELSSYLNLTPSEMPKK